MRTQLFPYILFAIVNLLIDYYIYRRIISRYFRNLPCRIGYWTISIVLTTGLFSAVHFAKSNDGSESLIPYMWLIFLYFSVYLPKAVYTLVSLPDYIPCLFRHSRTKGFSIAGGVLAILLFGGMAYGALWGRNHEIVNEITYTSARLPEGFDGYRIVQFSDLHLGNYEKNNNLVQETVDGINALKPDLIVFTGDLVTRKTDELFPYTRILSQLHAPDGVYSILGNHDYGDYARWKNPADKAASVREMIRTQEEMGWRMLNNSDTVLVHRGDTINLIGVENWGEPPFTQYGDLKKAMQNTDARRFTILLTHNPRHWDAEVIGKTNIDLSLAGHTHAMQIKIGFGKFSFSPSRYFYPRWSGLYTEEEQSLYVNDGIGYVFLPMRIGASPELTVIELKKR